mgnify:CR=1 FL=1
MLNKKYSIETIFDITENLYFEIRKNEEFYNKFFKKYDISRLIGVQKETIAHLLGYKSNVTEINLVEKHKHLNIKEEDWNTFVKIVIKVLNDFKLEQKEIDFVLGKLSRIKDQIITAE